MLKNSRAFDLGHLFPLSALTRHFLLFLYRFSVFSPLRAPVIERLGLLRFFFSSLVSSFCCSLLFLLCALCIEAVLKRKRRVIFDNQNPGVFEYNNVAPFSKTVQARRNFSCFGQFKAGISKVWRFFAFFFKESEWKTLKINQCFTWNVFYNESCVAFLRKKELMVAKAEQGAGLGWFGLFHVKQQLFRELCIVISE